MSGMPLLRSAFQRVVRSTESKADLMFRNATFSGRLNSRCSSDSSRSTRMASVVEKPKILGSYAPNVSVAVGHAREIVRTIVYSLDLNICVKFQGRH